MTQKLSESIASFLGSIIEMGVCEKWFCANAYQEPTEELLRPIVYSYWENDARELPTQPMVSSTPLIHFSGDYAHTVGAVSGFCGAACHLISTPEQISSSLADYIDTTFTAISMECGAMIDTLLWSLCLVERVQKANLYAYYSCLEHQSEGVVASKRKSLPTGCAPQVFEPRQPSPFISDEFFSEKYTFSVVPLRRAADDATSRAHYCDLLSRARCDSNQTVDSRMGLSNATCRCSLSSEVGVCATTLCSAQEPQHNEGSELPPQMPYSLCSVCRSRGVFSLQYYNIHLILAACLLLSFKFGAAASMDKMASDAIAVYIARTCGCDVSRLLLAEWLISSILDHNITISKYELEGLQRRLGIVEVME